MTNELAAPSVALLKEIECDRTVLRLVWTKQKTTTEQIVVVSMNLKNLLGGEDHNILEKDLLCRTREDRLFSESNPDASLILDEKFFVDTSLFYVM